MTKGLKYLTAVAIELLSLPLLVFLFIPTLGHAANWYKKLFTLMEDWTEGEIIPFNTNW